MSAKSSLIHGKDFHLFKDCFDDEHVYLRLENTEFEACLLYTSPSPRD